MHELSIADALVDQILDEAREHGMSCVNEVEVHTGMLRQVVPEVMQEAFREVRVGTIVQDAVLVIKEIDAEAQCCICNLKFKPDLDCFVCPSCHKADVEILKGNEIILAAINGI